MKNKKLLVNLLILCSQTQGKKKQKKPFTKKSKNKEPKSAAIFDTFTQGKKDEKMR